MTYRLCSYEYHKFNTTISYIFDFHYLLALLTYKLFNVVKEKNVWKLYYADFYLSLKCAN